VVGAFAEMSEDASRVCDITAHDLLRTHVPNYNDDSKRGGHRPVGARQVAVELVDPRRAL